MGPVWPRIGLQLAPAASHCTHWWLVESGAGLQLPVTALSVWPTASVPVKEGARVLESAPAATVEDAAEVELPLV